MESYEIRPEWLTTAQTFADLSLASRRGQLARRGQFNVEKIRQDIVNGVVAEFAVQEWALERFDYCSTPDTQVYAVREKSWAPDLVTESARIHVKTYSNPRWNSWVFTYAPDRRDVDPVVEEPDERDYLALTQVDNDKQMVHVKFVLRAGSVINLYRAPKLDYLVASKLVLYPVDLQHVPRETWTPKRPSSNTPR